MIAMRVVIVRVEPVIKGSAGFDFVGNGFWRIVEDESQIVNFLRLGVRTEEAGSETTLRDEGRARVEMF